MTPLYSPIPTPERRLSRDRRLVIGSILLVLTVSATYLFMVISGTDSIRTRNALERNSDTARLSARLLDEQCENAIDVLQALGERPGFEDQLRQQSLVPLQDYLNDAVAMIPNLQAAAIYGPTGQRILAYPPETIPPGSAAPAAWFQEVSRNQRPFIGNVFRLRKQDAPMQDGLRIAIPIGGRTPAGPAGYLLAYYRLRDIKDSLRDVRIAGGSVLILDRTGKVIATGGAISEMNKARVPRQTNSIPLQRAFRGQTGALLTDDPLGGEQKSIVGYALAVRPEWALIVTQPVEHAFASSEYLLRRLTLILVPLLGLLVWIAWLLLKLYHRQQTLTRQLAERNEALYRQDRAKTDLLANVSHGLKTPIASMQLSVSGVLDRGSGSNPGQIDECLTLVSQELDELEGRVRNLLDMSRLDAGSVPIRREPCDLTDIAASALERLRPLLQNRGVQANFPPDPLMVEVDLAQIETVLINLLENAVKYSPPRTTLYLSGSSERGFATITVRDEGAGVAEVEQERIFEKFYRTATHSRAGGTGLGLAICRAVVEAHGGTISVRNSERGGAEFTVRLPGIAEQTLSDSSSIGERSGLRGA
ncbi:MAG: ATP-binding protein [Armatimonadota bacterium]